MKIHMLILFVVSEDPIAFDHRGSIPEGPEQMGVSILLRPSEWMKVKSWVVLLRLWRGRQNAIKWIVILVRVGHIDHDDPDDNEGHDS